MLPDNVTPLRPQIPCPQCKKTNNRIHYPFCSKRCADLDLGAWLDGKYTLEGDLYSERLCGKSAEATGE